MHHDELTPNQRFYIGEITADEAVKLERERVRAERRDLGNPTLNAIMKVIGVVLFLPLILIDAITDRRS